LLAWFVKASPFECPKRRILLIRCKMRFRILLRDDEVKSKAEEFAQIMAQWDASKNSAEILFQKFGQ